MTNQDFFFCYKKDLMKFLRYEKGLSYIVRALNPNNSNEYWMFERTSELNKALEEYNTQ